MAINSLTPTSKGIGGLVSGMDTQSLVEQMLKGTQAKIDAKNQQKSVLAYKQSMYRGIATRMKTFQDTFFSFSNPTSNLLSSQMFQAVNVATQSKFLTATAGVGASPGNVTVNNIKQLATKHKETSASAASSALKGEFSADDMQKIKDSLSAADKADITISVGEGYDEQKIVIKYTDIVGKSTQDAVDVINNALSGTNTSASFVNNKIQITQADGYKVKIATGANISGTINDFTANETGAVFSLDTKAALPKININFDGVTKAVSFNPFDKQGGETEIESVARQLNEGITKAFGSGISFTTSGNEIKLELSSKYKSSTVTLTGDTKVMNTIGIKSGLSNKVSLKSSISDVNFSTSLSGNMQNFTINGEEFSFSSGTSIQNIISTINSSDAGVKVTYDANTDKFSMESTKAGETAGNPFTIKQTEGNLMSVMFGAQPSSNYTSQGLAKIEISSSATFKKDDFKFEGGDVSFKVTKDGKTNTFTIGLEATDSYTDFVDKINETIAGVDSFKNPDGTAMFKMELTDNGDNTVTANIVTNNPGDPDFKVQANGESLNMLGYTAKFDGTAKLSELGFDDFTYTSNGITINVSKDMTLDDFVMQLKNTSGASEAKLETIGSTPFIRLAGVTIPMQFSQPAASKLFGADIQAGNGEGAQFDVSSQILGKDAVATVNGVEIQRNSNTFTVDGVTITLTGETTEAQEVTVTKNNDMVFDTLKKFVGEYNKLVDEINGILTSEATYKKYPPLTDDQRNAMSEKEVELWDEKAKGGLLRGDSTLQNVLTSLRSTLYTKPEGSTVALYDLGITTNDYYGKKDNIAIKDEAELKQRIAENPDSILKLFTDAEKGMATLMNTAVEKAISRGSTPGSLVQMAGYTGTTDTTSSIYKQNKSIDQSLESLNRKYTKEYDRYWKQFSAMEQMISKMNQQSSWLTQQVGG